MRKEAVGAPIYRGTRKLYGRSKKMDTNRESRFSTIGIILNYELRGLAFDSH